MTDSTQKLREALLKIAAIAKDAADDLPHDGNEHGHAHGDEMPSCSIKALPKRLIDKAADTASAINPMNQPAIGSLRQLGIAGGIDRMSISVLTTKYWGPAARRLTVSFIESPSVDLRARILSHMNAWSAQCGIAFVETRETGEVRISLEDEGYWSYLGTDILHIPANRPTMNLQGFSMRTPETEYKRVVRHETGHTLGFPHEHMRRALVERIDKIKAYAYFEETQGWSRAMVDQQVLTSLDERQLMRTRADQTSIMCYQLPGQITLDGRPIAGGTDINATDIAFAARIYPKSTNAPTRVARAGASHSHHHAHSARDDWSESEDVLPVI